MTRPHADTPQEPRPDPGSYAIEEEENRARGLDPTRPSGLTPEAEQLLAGDVPPPAPEREPTDWQAVVLSIAERSRPARREAERQRTDRQRRIDSERRRRVILATLDRLDRRFGRFRDAQVDGQPVVARWVLDAISGSRDGLVIRGAVGVGKTHLAVAAYRAVVAGGIVPAVAVSVPALLDGLRPGREPVEDLRACEDARLLLLDDLAAERVTDWTSETLYRLIDARYARRLPTIVTTNASGQQIREGLGERVASRLNGLGRFVTLDGPDRRAPTGN
jgi:DNA replication protein DnaC